MPVCLPPFTKQHSIKISLTISKGISLHLSPRYRRPRNRYLPSPPPLPNTLSITSLKPLQATFPSFPSAPVPAVQHTSSRPSPPELQTSMSRPSPTRTTPWTKSSRSSGPIPFSETLKSRVPPTGCLFMASCL